MMNKAKVKIEQTMDTPSESSASIDNISRPSGDISPSSDINSELFDQTEAIEGSIPLNADHATVTPFGQEKQEQKRKQAKPMKQVDRALQEIQRLRESTKNVISKRSFERFVYARPLHLLLSSRSLLASFHMLQIGATTVDGQRCRSHWPELSHHR